MRLLLKQKIFSWFDSYNIYNEFNEPVFSVQGKLSWGHRLEISGSCGNFLGRIDEEIFTFLPRFNLYVQEQKIGEIRKEFTFFKQVYTLNCNDWKVEGDIWNWNFSVTDSCGNLIMQVEKQIFNFSDTYLLDIPNPENALLCLMIVLAIDAANCSND